MSRGASIGWTAWDARLAVRAIVFAGMAVVLVLFLTAATDEGGVAWDLRVGRTLPLAPACAAIGAWLALRPARARGETRALEALGRSPWDAERGAAIGAAAIAIFVAGFVASSNRVRIDGFFPAIQHGSELVFEAGAFVDHGAGYRIERAGNVTMIDAAQGTHVDASSPPHARAAASLATLLAGVAIPIVIVGAAKRSAARAWASAFVCALAMLIAFQLAAAAKLTAFAAVVPPFVLLIAYAPRRAIAAGRSSPVSGA